MTAIHWIQESDPDDSFPDVRLACTQPDGLLAAGGDLSISRLLCAYRRGIFPWYEQGQEILWWSPNPRLVIYPNAVHISRSLNQFLKREPLRISINTAFSTVVKNCAAPRQHFTGTWITPEMSDAYQSLHQHGWAHSLEVWRDDELAGGIYGVALGQVFFGESMFSHSTNGSKIALVFLAKWLEKWNFALIDCQVKSAHLLSMGGVELPREKFINILTDHCQIATPEAVWKKRQEIVF